MSEVNVTPTGYDVARFWMRVKKSDNGCWIFDTPRDGETEFGHRFFYVQKQAILAHRFSWQLINGPIPDGMMICHNCPTGDNPSCVNPEHLFIGTQGDNVQDCINKGRFKPGWVPGSKNGFSKLTEEQVIAIRAAFANGARQVDLAKQYHVGRQAIYCIVRGKNWKHIPDQ